MKKESRIGRKKSHYHFLISKMKKSQELEEEKRDVSQHL